MTLKLTLWSKDHSIELQVQKYIQLVKVNSPVEHNSLTCMTSKLWLFVDNFETVNK